MIRKLYFIFKYSNGCIVFVKHFGQHGLWLRDITSRGKFRRPAINVSPTCCALLKGPQLRLANAINSF